MKINAKKTKIMIIGKDMTDDNEPHITVNIKRAILPPIH